MKSSIAVAIAALGLIIATFFIANAYKYKFKSTENITVTGGAEKDFVSDQIVWTGNYSRKMLDLKAAYALLKEDEAKIKTYLSGKGLAANEMVFSAINIDKEFSYRYDENGRQTGSDFTGYNLKQSVTVDSKNIDKVEKISREVTELIESGIEFNSSAPAYYYTKLSELKIDLLAKATA
ncbi:MAG TPA: SIMPL domain-containing protein, partial [Chitinophagaceae bacterium]|nr:SIMPL domain-containing protein [Chitinophagaceae bacterium]